MIWGCMRAKGIGEQNHSPWVKWKAGAILCLFMRREFTQLCCLITEAKLPHLSGWKKKKESVAGTIIAIIAIQKACQSQGVRARVLHSSSGVSPLVPHTSLTNMACEGGCKRGESSIHLTGAVVMRDREKWMLWCVFSLDLELRQIFIWEKERERETLD